MTRHKNTAYLACLLVLSGNLFAASTHQNLPLDRAGYPLDDPLYDDIRAWDEAEENGLRQFRADEFRGAYATLKAPAQHGFKRAQHAMALMHMNGNGVEKNILVGIALLGLAAESGDRKLGREYKKAVKALPKKYQPLVREQTAYYIVRYGMEAQGVSCREISRTGSNLKQMSCAKQPGNYEVYDWAP